MKFLKIFIMCLMRSIIFNVCLFIYLFIYLAASGLSCGTWDLRCRTRDLLLRRAGSLLWRAGLVVPRHVGS